MAFNLESLQKAKYLCSPEGERKINENRSKGNIASRSNYDDIPTDTYISENDMYRQGHLQNNNRQRSINETALPDIIKQSFSDLEIDVNSLDPQYKQTKAFDDIVETLTRENGTLNSSIKYQESKPINEALYQQSYPNNMGIDYNIIARIIDECLDRKLKALNESTIKGIRLKDGKIALQDHQGNVYSAKLELKGNVNQKK